MVQAMSLFNQLLQHFPVLEFAALVRKHNAERAAKGFSCRAQLVAMLFCQLAHADSLRDICNGLACCMGKLIHLGIEVAPNKSTLAYANRHRRPHFTKSCFMRHWHASATKEDWASVNGSSVSKTSCCRSI